MSGDWSHPYPPGYREQLEAEARQTSLPRERKAAIVEELERLGKRTADEARGDVETRSLGPKTAGRAPASGAGEDEVVEL